MTREEAISKAKKNPDHCYNFDSGDRFTTEVMFCSWRKRLVFTTHTPSGFKIV